MEIGPNPKCWQFLVKERKRQSEPIYPDRYSAASALIAPIAFREAQSFVSEYEWLGNMGAAKYCYGLFVQRHLAAVVCYTTPASPNAYRTLIGHRLCSRVYQLCRGASAYWAPIWAPSKLISRSLRIMAREFGAVMVSAYADPAAGEIGVVYQASNAVYLGMTRSRGPGKYIIGGVEYHARAVQKHFGCAAHRYLVEIDPHYQRIQRTRKHRYVFLTGDRFSRLQILQRLAPLIEPYPKRAVARFGARFDSPGLA